MVQGDGPFPEGRKRPDGACDETIRLRLRGVSAHHLGQSFPIVQIIDELKRQAHILPIAPELFDR